MKRRRMKILFLSSSFCFFSSLGLITSRVRVDADVDKEATEEECRRACELACADEFIQKMPDKYNTHIEQGGSNVSGGQKQRLCIARALLKKPKILILDEATANIDTETESLITEALEYLMAGRTTIMVAHRLSTIQNADLILVLQNGKITEQGTHDKLLELGGTYKRLYEQQFRDDVDEFARALIALGVKAGSHVAVWASNVPQWYIAFWATVKIGAVLVTVNTAYKRHEADYLFRQSDTHTLVMVESCLDSNYKEIINHTIQNQIAERTKQGEFFFSGNDGFVGITDYAQNALGNVVYVDMPDVDAEILKNGTEEQYARENIRFGACARSDVWISAWGSENTKTMQSIDGDKLKQKRLANKENRKSL